MFKDPLDVKYFQAVELITANGLRVRVSRKGKERNRGR